MYENPTIKKLRHDMADARSKQFEDPFKRRADAMKEITVHRAREVELEASGVQQAGLGLAATKRFRAAYSAIASDSVLSNVAASMDRQMVAAGSEVEPWERYQFIGDRLEDMRSDPDLAVRLKEAAQQDADATARMVLEADVVPTDGSQHAASAIDKMRAGRKQST